MPLPSSGVIKFSNINVELGVAANTTRKLSDSAVRTLFGVASGRITLSNGRGKANSFTFNRTLSTNTQNYNLRTDAIAAGWDGVVALNATVTVNSGVYVWSDSTATAGFATGSISAGSTVNITNNGFIIGKGGGEGATTGGPAMNISYPVTITNNNYIAGGGGAGGGPGGGGAGGGQGVATNTSRVTGGAGGAVGASGGNGTATTAGGVVSTSGGGGGRILPGTGGLGVTQISGGGALNAIYGAVGGRGGGGGGGGGAMFVAVGQYASHTATGGIGGGSNTAGSNGAGGGNGPGGHSGGGGGGGWGASGGSGVAQGTTIPGSAGGKAVNLNGNTVTWLVNGTRWGAIS